VTNHSLTLLLSFSVNLQKYFTRKIKKNGNVWQEISWYNKAHNCKRNLSPMILKVIKWYIHGNNFDKILIVSLAKRLRKFQQNVHEITHHNLITCTSDSKASSHSSVKLDNLLKKKSLALSQSIHSKTKTNHD